MIGEKHGLAFINILNRDATLNEEAGPYAEMDRFAARKKMWADMEAAGLTIKTEPYTHMVPVAQRGGELIEPMITGEPYPIKALIVYGVNLLHSIPNVPRTIEALKKLDLVVAIDVLPMEHVAWADIVLPEATIYERFEDVWTVSHKTPYIALREPAVEPYADTKPAWWMARELGLRVGAGEVFQWETVEEFVATRLQSIGYTVEKLREEGGVIVQKGQALSERLQGRLALQDALGQD